MRDPLGGINSLWPLFGIANQLLAAIALCVATTIVIKSGRARYAWVTATPLLWLVTVTSSAAWAKLFDPAPRIGFLAHAADLQAKLAAGTLSPELTRQLPQLLFNDHVNTALTALFLTLTWILILDTARVCYRVVRGLPSPPFAEAPYAQTQLAT